MVGYLGNLKAKFEKKILKIINIKKINSSEAVWGIKLKLCRIVSNNSLYKSIVFFLLLLLKHCGCVLQLKVSVDL